VLLLAGACAFLRFEPWHGVVVLSLSERHGVDAGDLPAVLLFALAVAIAHGPARSAWRQPRWLVGRRARAASAALLGALLVIGLIDSASTPRLVPAGGGTFAGSTQHDNGQRSEPVGRWSHLAVTYDGKTLRLYEDGTPVSSQAISGTILKTKDPLWIGGNRPYGEHFQGVIDDVRVYNRALRASEVRAEMSTPVAGGRTAPAEGLVGAYGFDAGSGATAADASGNRNIATIRGASWTTRGRFHRALRFDGGDDVVRVPASASLNLSTAMTLSAWVRPTESQSGWRTVLARQTDAYFLMAGGGRRREGRLQTIDGVRVPLLIIAAIWGCLALAGARAPSVRGRRLWYWPPVALFVAGSAADAALTPSDTLIGPTLVALWFALVASRRGEAAVMWVLVAAFAGVTVVSVADPGALALGHDHGGIARSAALGLLIATAGLQSARASGASGGPARAAG
jgi:hypothetical protein